VSPSIDRGAVPSPDPLGTLGCVALCGHARCVTLAWCCCVRECHPPRRSPKRSPRPQTSARSVFGTRPVGAFGSPRTPLPSAAPACQRAPPVRGTASVHPVRSPASAVIPGRPLPPGGRPSRSPPSLPHPTSPCQGNVNWSHNSAFRSRRHALVADRDHLSGSPLL